MVTIFQEWGKTMPDMDITNNMHTHKTQTTASQKEANRRKQLRYSACVMANDFK
jgi:hypothetical protein